jgi:hypothetical protein
MHPNVMPKMMETGASLYNKSIRSHYFVGEQNVRHTAMSYKLFIANGTHIILQLY